MRPLIAFMQKEVLELYRTGKLFLMVILFVLFGIMNPAFAKLTPWLMELSAESLKESGMVLGSVEVDAMTSWAQFYKNVPIVLIVFVILSSAILTNEYQKGTLINMLTKGLQRWKIMAAKEIVLIVLIFLFSSFMKGNSAVLIGVAAVVGVSYLAGMIPKLEKYLPTRLLSSGEMLSGAAKVSDFYGAMLVTAVLYVAGLGLAVVVFNRKNV